MLVCLVLIVGNDLVTALIGFGCFMLLVVCLGVVVWRFVGALIVCLLICWAV